MENKLVTSLDLVYKDDSKTSVTSKTTDSSQFVSQWNSDAEL